jgi:hypothetical protein
MIRPMVWSSALATYELVFGSHMEGKGDLPKYRHSRPLVPGRGNLVVHRYVPLHVTHYEVSISSPFQNMVEMWAGGEGGDREEGLENVKRRWRRGRRDTYSNKSPTAIDKNSNPLYFLLPISSGSLLISTPNRK